jgi:hypothetical protein
MDDDDRKASRDWPDIEATLSFQGERVDVDADNSSGIDRKASTPSDLLGRGVCSSDLIAGNDESTVGAEAIPIVTRIVLR